MIHYSPRWDLTTIPDAALKTERARRNSAPLAGSTTPADELSAIRRAASLSRKTFAGGRKLSRKKRCPCGKMTAKRAKTLYHKCVA